MKNTLTIVAAVAAAVFAQVAFAQASSPTRADVKAEAAAAPKTPAGDAAGAMIPAPDTKSTTTRADRKATTEKARKEGELAKAGENSAGAKAAAPSKSNKTRAERKAQTEADVKAGKTAPAGAAQDQK